LIKNSSELQHKTNWGFFFSSIFFLILNFHLPIKETIDTSGFVRRFGGGEIDGIELGKKRAKKP
jgi:hypothetical protein